MIIDTHVHLDHRDYFDDIQLVTERAKEAGVERFIIPGANPDDLPRAIELCERFEGLYFAVGVHPYDIEQWDGFEFEAFLSHPKCVAVGECGLDYYRLPSDEEERGAIKRKQKEVFIAQINLARTYKKPLIVHIREATHDSKLILDQYASDLSGVLHCFNASPELLHLKGDFYYGIGGVLTFSNAKALVEIAPKIPLSKLLLETDGPYLTPHPHRGKRNEPLYTTLVLKKLAQLQNIDEIELEKIIQTNTYQLFAL